MNTAVRDAWAAELAVDRGQEWEDTQVARATMQRRLDSMYHAKAERDAEIRKYPLRPDSAGRDIPIVDGHLPPRLVRLMEEADAEQERNFWRELAELTERGRVSTVDTSKLVGTSNEFMVHQAAASIIQERLGAPERMRKTRIQQAAVDAMHQPRRAPQDAPKWSAWGQL